ncbi:hypothetical protein RUND412_000112 [Rhizina undulata]
MPYFPNTPEAHIAFLSRRTKMLCRGISDTGQTCSRLSVLSKYGEPTSGIIAVIEGEEAFFCDKHQDQAKDVVFRHTTSFVRQRELARRESMDTVIEEIELLVAGGVEGRDKPTVANALGIAGGFGWEDPFVEGFAEKLQISDVEMGGVDSDSDMKFESEIKSPYRPRPQFRPNDNCYTRKDSRALDVLWRFFFCTSPNEDPFDGKEFWESAQETELKPAVAATVQDGNGIRENQPELEPEPIAESGVSVEAVLECEDGDPEKEMELYSVVAAILEDDGSPPKETETELLVETVPVVKDEDEILEKDTELNPAVNEVVKDEDESPKEEPESKVPVEASVEGDNKYPEKEAKMNTPTEINEAEDGGPQTPTEPEPPVATVIEPEDESPKEAELGHEAEAVLEDDAKLLDEGNREDSEIELMASPASNGSSPAPSLSHKDESATIQTSPRPTLYPDLYPFLLGILINSTPNFNKFNELYEDETLDLVPIAKDNVTHYAFSLIPPHLTPKTVLRLKQELAKPFSTKDEPGYIYVFRLNDTPHSAFSGHDVMLGLEYSEPTRDTVLKRAVQAGFYSSPRRTLLKIGRASNVQRRLHQWNTLCGYDLSLIRYYPHVSSSVSTSPAAQNMEWLNSQVGRKVYNSHRVETLIHLELRDVEGSNFIHVCESCGREHKEFFWIEATRAGLKGVDEVIKRWVEYAEKTGGAVTADMEGFSTPTPKERRKRGNNLSGPRTPIKVAVLEAMAKQFSPTKLTPFPSPIKFRIPGKTEVPSPSLEADMISCIKDTDKTDDAQISEELEAPEPMEIQFPSETQQLSSGPEPQTPTKSTTLKILEPPSPEAASPETIAPAEENTEKDNTTPYMFYSEQDALLQALEIQFSMEFQIPIKFCTLRIHEFRFSEANVSPDIEMKDWPPHDDKEDVD